jgi:ParB family transcriptional regulator, chromosome partitioning protein
MATKLAHIPISKIRENPVALRSVNRTTEEYTGLVDSIRRSGVLNPVLVREVQDPDTKDIVYGLIDGLHRFTASQDAGQDTIPAQITSMEDAAVLEAQILANVH